MGDFHFQFKTGKTEHPTRASIILVLQLSIILVLQLSIYENGNKTFITLSYKLELSQARVGQAIELALNICRDNHMENEPILNVPK